jgi:enoyl-CoA hydratase
VSGAPGVFVEIDDRGIAEITISHPGKLNILNSALMGEMIAATERLSANEDLRAIVLRGAGDKAFIGGADIGEMATLDATSVAAFITRLHRVCEGLRRLTVPVIARIDGYALGAGLEVAASCDLRVASHRSVFGMPEVKVGIPSVIEAALLPALIGWGRTRQLLLTGATIGAAEAERWGLVERVTSVDGLDGAVEEMLQHILAAGPRALALQKDLIRYWEDHDVTRSIDRGIASFAEAFATDEPRRMMRGFLDAKARRRGEKPD